MLNFKNTNIIFLIILLISIFVRVFFTYPELWILIPFLIYVLILFWGSKNICSQFYLKVNCNSTDKSKIHLTFDDGPDPDTTPKILEILKKYNVEATFFCIGEKIQKYPETVKQIDLAGHKIANHSYSHSAFFDFFRTSKVISELEKTNHLILELTGKKCTEFRPPFGVTNPNIAKAVKKLKMETIGWNIRSLDTLRNKKRIMKRITGSKPGDTVLFHDTKQQTIEILDDFLRL